MPLTKLRDPVHNFVRFNEGELKLINTDVLQRLRGIRQLAMESFVYPGALHTRFDHTLGVAHVAGQMAEELGLDDSEHRFVREAAILHDIGHGPFSHVSETVLERFANRDELPTELKREKIHEVITGHLIRNHAPLVDVLGKTKCEEIAQLLSEGYGEPILRSIVSGPLDADKQDYLLRDSHYCGVNYGVFDVHQLQRSLISEQIDEQKQLMIRHDGIHAVEQFVLAKYYLTSMVYRHKIRLITDQMIIRAIGLGIEKDQIRALRKLYAFDNSPEFFRNYLTWDDARFMMTFGVNGKRGTKCKDILDRLQKRQLLKRVYYSPVKEFNEDVREKLMDIGDPENSSIRSELESAIGELIAEELNTTVDSDHVIVHSYQIKSVREASRNDEASILVYKGPVLPGKFEDESVLFSSINERLADEFVEVYAPVSWQEHADRTRILNKISPPIKELISERLVPIQPQLNL
ncbi:MAG: hypothetical protein DME97_18000 [Verrucomicrobia bacterium]|nr:MAG: hypothetical protein DME97_18000 [Verrucomicrobiota bacterium]